MSLAIGSVVERRPQFEAVQFTGGVDNGPALASWVVGAGGSAVWLDAQQPDPEAQFAGREESIRISTPEGTATAYLGDIIVKDQSNVFSVYTATKFTEKFENV